MRKWLEFFQPVIHTQITFESMWGGGVNRKGGPYYRKNDFHTEGLLEGGGGVNSEVGFNRDFTVKQQPD